MTSGIRVPPELIERDPEVLAPAAGLIYLPDSTPGWTRRRRGRGFSYADAFGTALAGSDRARIEALAIPPAWTSVWICPEPDGYLQATGLDDAGRKQHRYHPEFRSFCDGRKFDRLRYFARAVVVLRKAAAAGLEEETGSRDHAIAAAITLIDRCLLRVGNHQSAANGHFGATTLTVEHVVDDGFMTLDYTAKSGKTRTIVVEDDELVDILGVLAEGADRELFWFDESGEHRRATASDVNRFIVEHAGPAFSAKDYRTWGGTATALAARADGCEVLHAVDAAADELGNTRAVARRSYVHPVVLEAEQHVIDIAWSRSRSSRWLERSESALAKLLTSAEGVAGRS
ncbi:MAG: hypothetical protein R2710_03415 [Acidimicrobiales bacterium]